MLSPSISVGEGRTGRGEQVDCGCQTAVPARFRFPPPDSGVMPFSKKPSSPIKSDFCLSGHAEYPLENIVMLSSSPLQPGGEAKFHATVPTGLADSHEPTSGCFPDWREAFDAGIAWASWLIQNCLPILPNCQTSLNTHHNNGLGLKSGPIKPVDYWNGIVFRLFQSRR